MKKTRLTALLMTLVLSLSLAVPAAAYSKDSLISQKKTYSTAFTDTKGTWCDAYVQTCYEAGLLEGTSKTAFSPDDNLSGAQVVAITARLHSRLNGGTGVFPAANAGDAWYQPALDYLENIAETDHALLYSLLSIDLSSECSRYAFISLLHGVLPSAALTPINQITATPDLIVTATSVLDFYNAGILTGSDSYGTFHGTSSLTRGEAAAILARMVDPSQRVRFTPAAFSWSQALLGLPADTVILTIDGYAVTAEAYGWALATAASNIQLDSYYAYFTQYPEAFEAWMSDVDYTEGFDAYLLEKEGIDVNELLKWDAPDKGGMTPAAKAKANALDQLTQQAVLMNHQSEYPLTAFQKITIATNVESAKSSGLAYGFSSSLSDLVSSVYLMENLVGKYNFSATQTNDYLAQSGYVYGQYVLVQWDEDGYYQSKESAAATAETVRIQMINHLDDPDYLEYLVWKNSDSYESAPDLISISDLSTADQSALKNLRTGSVSAVLEGDHAYLVVLKQNPALDSDLSTELGFMAAETQLAQWASAAQITTTPAYDAVDVASVYTAYSTFSR